MDNEEVLYRFTLPYPWKKTLSGIKWITVGILAVLLPIFIYQDWKRGALTSIFNMLGYVVLILIMAGIYFLMRYALIHGDKIKAPIEVWITSEEYHYKKGNYHTVWRFDNIKKVKVIMDDNKLLIITDYKEKVGTMIGWQTGFKRSNELADLDYGKFIKEKWMPLMNIVLERIKEYSPDAVIEIYDRRKKYR